MSQKHINLSALPTEKCKCGNVTFNQVAFLKRVPGLMIGQSSDELIPVPGFACTKCQKLYEFGKDDQKKPDGLQKMFGFSQ